MKLRKGDTVIVIAGGNSKRNDDKGKVGEIIAIDHKNNTVTVAGVNVITKHIKPTQNNPEGSIKTYEAPIDASNVAYYDSKAKKVVKIGYMFEDGKKIRINKETGLPLDKKAAKKKTAKKVAEEAEAPVEEAPAKKTAAKKTTAKKTTTKKAEGAEEKAPAKKTTAKKTTKKVEEEAK